MASMPGPDRGRPLLLHFARNGAYGPGGKELLVLERGEGAYVFDTAGRRYADGLSSLFCSQLGYSYGEEMAAAAREQLAARAPAGIEHVFFTSGGSESVESAWKLVRQFHIANGEPGRVKAIARDVAYHGVTLGALSFTGVASYRDPFGPPAVPTRHVSNTNAFRRAEQGEHLTAVLLDELEQAILAEGPETVAMVIAEPVQNAGGCLQPPPGYWPGLRALCDRYGILLVADEVITGFGRLGELFAVDRFGVVPDLITVAKGITAAYAPMGAVLAAEHVAAPLFEEDRTLLHGITFGGHPVSAAIALKTLEIVERDEVLEHVRRHEGGLARRMDELRELPIVGDVRGSGFFWAAELVADGDAERFDAPQREELLRRFLPGALLDAGLIARGDDRGDAVVQIAPPLIADDDVLDDVVGRLEQVLVRAGEHMRRHAATRTPAAV